MSVSALDSSLLYNAKSTITTVGDSTLDSDDFMNLLITQLQYQDPLEPMDTSDMASQLAQFSNMEAIQEMADNIESLLDYQVSQNNLQLTSLLGTEVTASSNIVSLSDGKLSDSAFTLSAAVESCEVEIYDSSGNLVDSFEMGSLDGDTTYSLDWDGTNSAGNGVADGLYIFMVTGTTSAGEEVDVTYQTTGKVTGLDYESGSAVLTLGGNIPVEVGSVISVNDGTTNTATA